MNSEPEPREGDWGVLPHPIEEMQSAGVLVFVEGIPEPCRGTLLVEQHDTDSRLFSTVVLFSEMEAGAGAIGERRVRLPHEFQAAIGHPPADGGPYSLTVPEDFFRQGDSSEQRI